MKKLKNKVFSVIFAILTIFLLSILMIFNFQNYQQKVNEVKNNLMRMDENKNKNLNKIPNKSFDIPETPIEENTENREMEPRVFMDTTVYAIMLDSNLNITQVINHTTNDVSDEEIKSIAEQIIKNKGTEDINIGNLYFTNYSYLFTRDSSSLIIINNTNNKEELIQFLKTSIFIFTILEIIIIIVSNKLTSWIIKPVIESFNKQKQFIADASHELKTPLAIILASSEALENDPNEKKWLINIKSESERMNNLVSDLLELAKSEDGIKEQFINEDLSKLVEKSVLTFESLIYEKDVNLNYNIEENISFLCKGNQIKQVIGILMDNAIKHSFSKGKINVTLKKERGNIILSVANKGKEIPKEEREKIFERFYRIDESRNRNDNRYGLGLAIANNIVTNHNGKISVTFENGYTIFKVIFKY